jgi:hypothetical protein
MAHDVKDLIRSSDNPGAETRVFLHLGACRWLVADPLTGSQVGVD